MMNVPSFSARLAFLVRPVLPTALPHVAFFWRWRNRIGISTRLMLLYTVFTAIIHFVLTNRAFKPASGRALPESGQRGSRLGLSRHLRDERCRIKRWGWACPLRVQSLGPGKWVARGSRRPKWKLKHGKEWLELWSLWSRLCMCLPLRLPCSADRR